jgi:hypothetical protein
VTFPNTGAPEGCLSRLDAPIVERDGDQLSRCDVARARLVHCAGRPWSAKPWFGTTGRTASRSHRSLKPTSQLLRNARSSLSSAAGQASPRGHQVRADQAAFQLTAGVQRSAALGRHSRTRPCERAALSSSASWSAARTPTGSATSAARGDHRRAGRADRLRGRATDGVDSRRRVQPSPRVTFPSADPARASCPLSAAD